MIRLVICLDFETDSIETAYDDLRTIDCASFGPSFSGWETSDEAYTGDGVAIDPAALQSAICRCIEKGDDR